MRYGPEHKSGRVSASSTRPPGCSGATATPGVGIDGIMAAADLTRGGFYAHFDSKQSLFAEVLGSESDFVRRLRSAPEPGADGASEVIAGYLDPKHRDRVGGGCTLAALTTEVPRAGRAAQRAYAGNVEELAGEFEARVPEHAPDRRQRALQAMAVCVGGITLARGVGNDPIAAEILEACRNLATALVRGE